MSKLTFSDNAWKDYLYWQQQDKKTLRKINALLKDIERNGYQCIGKPEQMQRDYSGWWSVRIDEKNRLVFRIGAECLEILQCKGHYGDK
jgi:toxin YoeB